MNQLYEFLTTNHKNIFFVVLLGSYLGGTTIVLLKTKASNLVLAGLLSTLMGIGMLSLVFSITFYLLLAFVLLLWGVLPNIVIIICIFLSPSIIYYGKLYWPSRNKEE